MPIVLYRYPDQVPERYEDAAKQLYLAVVDFRTRQLQLDKGGKIKHSPAFGKYNVASFLVRIKDQTFTITSSSDREKCVHSEDRLVKELAGIGIKTKDVLAVFSEWPPCVGARPAERRELSRGIVFEYQPHCCHKMLGKVLNDGTPVFHGKGPVL